MLDAEDGLKEKSHLKAVVAVGFIEEAHQLLV
jgi:hypothetical protein